MVPTFLVGDQVESARTMVFFSTDLEEPSAAVVHAMVNCSDWSNQVWHPAALTKMDIYSDARTMTRTFTVISAK